MSPPSRRVRSPPVARSLAGCRRGTRVVAGAHATRRVFAEAYLPLKFLEKMHRHWSMFTGTCSQRAGGARVALLKHVAARRVDLIRPGAPLSGQSFRVKHCCKGRSADRQLPVRRMACQLRSPGSGCFVVSLPCLFEQVFALRWVIPILLSVGMTVVVLAVFPVANVEPTRATAGTSEPPPPVGWRYTKTGWIYFERSLPQAAEPVRPTPFAFHPALFALLQVVLSIGALVAASTRSTPTESGIMILRVPKN